MTSARCPNQTSIDEMKRLFIETQDYTGKRKTLSDAMPFDATPRNTPGYVVDESNIEYLLSVDELELESSQKCIGTVINL